MERDGLTVPDRRLAGFPILSAEGQRYLGAMAAAANYAFANRQGIAERARRAFRHVFGDVGVRLVYDVGRNVAKIVVRSSDERGPGEDAPLAYKDVADVVDACETAGIARKVARLRPRIVIKG